MIEGRRRNTEKFAQPATITAKSASYFMMVFRVGADAAANLTSPNHTTHSLATVQTGAEILDKAGE